MSIGSKGEVMNNIEPGAAMRQFAHAAYKMHVTLVQAGFTENQAKDLVVELLATMAAQADS
jgi:hypothetical protein